MRNSITVETEPILAVEKNVDDIKLKQDNFEVLNCLLLKGN